MPVAPALHPTPAETAARGGAAAIRRDAEDDTFGLDAVGGRGFRGRLAERRRKRATVAVRPRCAIATEAGASGLAAAVVHFRDEAL